ncbi:MAG: hypothetical protein KDA41_09740, partial [Planctomycetales bacterium]|nr:hypothetical protein [Planctomycetales bacterium]
MNISCRTFSCCALAAGILSSLAGALTAQERDFSELLDRLNAAELRIQELESRDVPQHLPPIGASGNYASFDSSFDASMAGRLNRLESEWAVLRAAEMDKDEKKDDYVAPTKPTFKIGGRVHLDHWAFPESSDGIGYFENPTTNVPAGTLAGDDPENRWLFRRVRLEMSGDVLETMVWRMQLDFHAPDSGEMKDVYIGWKELPYNQTLLLGHQKR